MKQNQKKIQIKQKQNKFLLTPKLFEKMKIKTFTNVRNHDIASGLRYVADELNKLEYLTTAWFIDLAGKQFYYMSF